MSKHNNAKNILFSEIGSNIGVYEDIQKIKSYILKGKRNSGTHLLDSIETAWSSIAVNGNIRLDAGWDTILTSSCSTNETTLNISKIISSNFFGPATNEKLEMLVYEGIVNARREIIRSHSR